MLSASQYYIDNVHSDPTVKVVFTFNDGRSETITGERIMSDGFTIDEATSSTSDFEIGATVMSQCTLKVYNFDRYFDDYDFTDATIEPWVGTIKEDGTTEWVKRGVYTVDNPTSYPDIIELTGLDLLTRFETDYSIVTTTHFPATLGEILRNMCAAININLKTEQFPNYDYVIENEIEQDSLTCLDMLSYIAQLACCYARMDNEGNLCLSWYDMDAVKAETADGSYIVLDSNTSFEVNTDDVVITGVQVNAQKEEDDDPDEVCLEGSDDYVLFIEDNILVEKGKASTVAAYIGKKVIGFTFRPFNVSAWGSPLYESGDSVLIVDRLERKYYSVLTEYTYSVGSGCSYACNAESVSRNSAASYSASTKAYQKAHSEVIKEKTARENAIERLTKQVDESSGLYTTTETQEDGSTVYYMHDKENLSESGVVWLLKADALSMSTDGGKSYPYVLNVDGEAILNRIYAIGIDAEHITSGSITDATGKNYWNLQTGEFQITGAKVGDVTLAAVVVAVDTQYGNSTDPSVVPTEWKTDPEWKAGQYLWSRTKTTMADGSSEYSTPVKIVGVGGLGVTSIEEQYYLSTSKETQDGGSWSAEQPEWQTDHYYWTRSKITYSDGTVTYTTPALATAFTSSNQAADEAFTAAAKAILSTTEEYYQSDSSDELKGGSWTDGNTWVDGKYTWRRTLNVYGDGRREYIPDENGICISGNTGLKGEDGSVLRIESTRGIVFKNNQIDTMLNAVIYKGAERITNLKNLRETYGESAYLQWSWQNGTSDTFGTISASDKRISNDGFTLTLTPDDINTKAIFQCQLICD